MLRCVAIMPGGICGLLRSIGAPCGLTPRVRWCGASGLYLEQLALLFIYGCVWWGFWSGGQFEDSGELTRVWHEPVLTALSLRE